MIQTINFFFAFFNFWRNDKLNLTIKNDKKKSFFFLLDRNLIFYGFHKFSFLWKFILTEHLNSVFSRCCFFAFKDHFSWILLCNNLNNFYSSFFLLSVNLMSLWNDEFDVFVRIDIESVLNLGILMRTAFFKRSANKIVLHLKFSREKFEFLMILDFILNFFSAFLRNLRIFFPILILNYDEFLNKISSSFGLEAVFG